MGYKLPSLEAFYKYSAVNIIASILALVLGSASIISPSAISSSPAG